MTFCRQKNSTHQTRLLATLLLAIIAVCPTHCGWACCPTFHDCCASDHPGSLSNQCATQNGSSSVFVVDVALDSRQRDKSDTREGHPRSCRPGCRGLLALHVCHHMPARPPAACPLQSDCICQGAVAVSPGIASLKADTVSLHFLCDGNGEIKSGRTAATAVPSILASFLMAGGDVCSLECRWRK